MHTVEAAFVHRVDVAEQLVEVDRLPGAQCVLDESVRVHASCVAAVLVSSRAEAGAVVRGGWLFRCGAQGAVRSASWPRLRVA